MQDTQQERKTADRRPLIVALILGALAAVLVIIYLGGADDKTNITPIDSPSRVVAALLPIQAGQRITAEMVEVKTLPAAIVPEGAFRAANQVVGKTARYPIEKGEMVTSMRLVQAARVDAISFQIPAGLRAMTIPVSSTQSPATLLAPGDFIDLLMVGASTDLLAQSLIPQRPNTQTTSITLLQNIQVLSVERGYVDNGVVYDDSVRGNAPSTGGVGYVTLAVTPDQAQFLWLAQKEGGELTFVLRPFGEKEILPLTPRFKPFLQP